MYISYLQQIQQTWCFHVEEIVVECMVVTRQFFLVNANKYVVSDGSRGRGAAQKKGTSVHLTIIPFWTTFLCTQLYGFFLKDVD